jgi:hypothetical protein
MPGFHECIKKAWDKHIPKRHNPLVRLHIKLSRTGKALKTWAKSLTSQGKLALVVCREVIHQLESAQETRDLSSGERDLIKRFRARILGLAAIEKCRARQRSRITWLRLGDANTKFFHLMANSRKKEFYLLSKNWQWPGNILVRERTICLQPLSSPHWHLCTKKL